MATTAVAIDRARDATFKAMKNLGWDDEAAAVQTECRVYLQVSSWPVLTGPSVHLPRSW